MKTGVGEAQSEEETLACSRALRNQLSLRSVWPLPLMLQLLRTENSQHFSCGIVRRELMEK